MVCCTMGIDITFTVSNIFLTTNMPSHRQGLAGAFINSILFLGISFFLGIADIAVGQTAHLGLRQSYKVAFWMAFGVASVPLLFLPFLKIGSAKSDLTLEERQKLEQPRRDERLAEESETEVEPEWEHELKMFEAAEFRQFKNGSVDGLGRGFNDGDGNKDDAKAGNRYPEWI